MFDRLRITTYFYWYKFFSLHPRISSRKATVKNIIQHNLSVARFGDGEVKILLGTSSPRFQELSTNLSEDLINAFNTRQPNLLICLADILYVFPRGSNERRFYMDYLYFAFRKARKLFDKKYIYGNTDITRFYHPALYKRTNFRKLDKYVELIKKIWQNRNIIFVEGKETKLGIGNDLFDGAKSIKRIVCPSKNAYSKKDDIKNAILNNYNENDLVLVALGPAASIIACEIAVLPNNIQIIDIGHIDIVYLWYQHRCKKIVRFGIKDVNEASTKDELIEIAFDEEAYNKQIVCKIE